MIGVRLVHKLGFIGYRNHAKKLLDIVESNQNFSITSIYHPTKKIDDVRGTKNLEDLYNCDGVIIASPNMTHFEYIKKLIENSDCFIFCEKPPVTSLDGIKYLENISPENKKRVFFNFNLRFSKINQIIKEYSDSEKLGKIIQINIISSMGFAFKNEYLNSWRSDGKTNLHNIIVNNSIHWIDLMVFNFGNVRNSSYIPRLVSNNGTSYDTNSVILELENDGLVCSIFSSYATPLIDDIMIVGTNGFINIKDSKIEIFSPRDTFDDNGLFKKPPGELFNDFNFDASLHASLENSVNHYLDHVKNLEGFDLHDFETAILSNKLTLSISDGTIN